jgi:AcrR family transcriptional regulator
VIDEITARVLAALEPDDLGLGERNWQQRKSVQTRITILEAAIDCLNQHGYARTTTLLISQIAGISRGAMLHHYATKHDLIASVIDYTAYKRMQKFMSDIRSLSDAERVDEMTGIELYWRNLLTREFNAYLELMMAARTDKELAEVFLPKARRYDAVELAEVVRAFPEWAANPNGYALAMDCCTATLQGLWLMNADTWSEGGRRERLTGFVARTLAMLRDGTLLVADDRGASG